MRLSWCNVSILYQYGHKHAYALSEFLPQTWKYDNRLEFCQKITLKSQKKIIYLKIWSKKLESKCGSTEEVMMLEIQIATCLNDQAYIS